MSQKLCKGQLSEPLDGCLDCDDYLTCFPIDVETQAFIDSWATVGSKETETTLGGKPT